MASDAPILAVENLVTEFRSGGAWHPAVRDVSFAVQRNETLAIVGESGCGKSVTALSIMGLVPPANGRVASGHIRFAGSDLVGLADEEMRKIRGNRISMIFQEPMTSLNPVLTIGFQVAEALRYHRDMGRGEANAAALELLDQVKIPSARQRFADYPHQFSGGMRQRVMIAMALACRPELLLADEPTTALDVTTQAQILELIRELQRKHGTGVLFITHDFGVVAEIADRVAVLRHGEVVEFAPARDVLAHPRHEYTRMLIAAVPSLQPRERAIATGAPIVLRTEQLTKTYARAGWLRRSDAVVAATSISLEIRRGETLGIVGESGSGKSTVARCIARLIDPTSGRILLDGEDVAQLGARALRGFRRRVQIVFQDPYRSLNPRRTVGDAIVEGPMNYGVARDAARANASRLMDLVRLDPGSLDRYPHQFSGGQRQRVCIARALAMEPELLIADEAVSALDVSVQAQVLALFDEIRAELDLAMLFITHDLRVAAQVCDRVAVMHKGRIVEEGPTGELFARPQHAYTKALFAAAPGRSWAFANDVRTSAA
jgi:peptide/nickel transport system ATP-binding protein